MGDDGPQLLGSYWTLAGDADPTGDGRQWSAFDFEDRVATAAEVGFDGIGLWHTDLEHILEERDLGEMRAILDEHGVDLLELEFLDCWFLDEDDERRRAADGRWELFLEVAEALDVRHVKLGNLRRVEAPKQRVREAFERLCAEACATNTLVGYELVPTDPNVEGIADLVEIVGGVDGGGGVLDTWHVAKMEISYRALRAIPRSDLVSVELNDGPVESDRGFSEETTSYRRIPGEGEFDIPAFIAAVDEMGYDGPWGIEVLSAELRETPMREAYERAYEGTMAQFEAAGVLD